jgi:5-methylcytosine-specific restriction endonuclease McrA
MTAAETMWGLVLDRTTARRLACDAAVTRVILDPDSQPLDVGRRSRIIPPAIRTALVARDRGCTYPGCDRGPQWTDAHHIRHWADGGTTSLDNLVLLCRQHHRAVHERDTAIPHAPPRAA